MFTLLLHGMIEQTVALRVEQSDPNRDASVCVWSRIIQSELPYVQSWIKYHESLGVQTFYLLTNHPHELNTIEGFLGGTSADLARSPISGSPLIRSQIKAVGSKATINLYSIDKGGADDEFSGDVTKHILAEITEDFVVGIDVDEFWVLPRGISTFGELIADDRNYHDVHYATWVMAPNDRLEAQFPPYPVWKGKEHKWMARTSGVMEFQCHDPVMKKGRRNKKHDQGDLLHFWGRSFVDQLLKGMTGTGTQKGGEGPANTIELLNTDLLPQRLKFLAFLVIHPVETNMSFEAPLMTIDKHLEMQYASEAFGSSKQQTGRMVDKALQTYVKFQNCLKQQADLPKYPGGQSLMGIATYLDDSPCNGNGGVKARGHELVVVDDLA